MSYAGEGWSRLYGGWGGLVVIVRRTLVGGMDNSCSLKADLHSRSKETRTCRHLKGIDSYQLELGKQARGVERMQKQKQVED